MMKSPKRKKIRSVLARRLFTPVFLLVVSVGLFILYLVHPPVSPLWKESLLVLAFLALLQLIDRAIIWFSFTELVEETASAVAKGLSVLQKETDDAGLVRVYKDREAAADDVLEAVGSAKDRVWMVAIALCFKPGIEEIVAKLQICKERNVDIKLLLFDPLRAPGVFRGLLEMSPSTLHEVFKDLSKKDPDTDALTPDTHALLRETLYQDCQTAINVLSQQANRFLEGSIKYYAHNPGCWMVIADRMLYFQPYTFGAPVTHRVGDRRVGPYMPVFAFEADSVAGTFEVFEDHFWKLWLTSDCGRCHFLDRWRHKEEIVAEVVQHRFSWFKHLHDNLIYATSHEHTKASDRRRWPRQQCGSKVAVQLQWTKNDDKFSVDAVIIDSSFGNLSLKLCKPALGSPASGDIATVSQKVAPSANVVQTMLTRFLNKKFIVRRVAADIVGLDVVQSAINSAAKSAGA